MRDKGTWEKRLDCSFPDINFEKHYFYTSPGRKIDNIRYFRFSKYFWEYYDTYEGDADYSDESDSMTVYLYKTEGVLCKYPDD